MNCYSVRGLYAIVDNSFSKDKTHVELAYAYLLGGCRLLQLRIKKDHFSIWDDEVFEIAKTIMPLKEKFDFTFIINDYVDVAAEIRADGVHVGENDMPIEKIRERIGNDLLFGYSSHSLDEALAAEKAGADYVALGAIFPTKTKGKGHPVQGVDRLEELVSSVNIPVVAIGGINRTNIDQVLTTGVDAVAMITALSGASNPVQETAWYVKHILDAKS